MENRKRIEAKCLRRSTERGTSVVEVLIVAVIIAVLAVVALPAGIRQIQLYRLDTTVNIISSKLMEARMNAIKRNRSSTLHLYSDERRTEISSTDDTGAAIDVGFSAPFAKDVVVVSDVTIDVTFDSLGRLAAGTGQTTVILQELNSDARKDVVISPAGRVSVSGVY